MGGDSRNDDVLSMTPVRLDLHVVNYLLGGAQLDNRLMLVVSTVLRLAGWEELNTVPERLTRLQSFADWWVSRNDETRRGATVFLHGPYGSGRLAAAQAICKSTGIPLLVADASLAARSVHPFELIVDLAYREADLKRAALCWSRCEVLLEENQIHHWDYLLSRSAKFCNLNFIASNKAWEPTGQFRARLYQRIDFPVPGYDLRRKLWEVHLPPTNRFIDPTIDRGHLAEQLANGFQLTEGQILDALDTAKELAFQFDPEHLRVAVDYFYEGCRRQSSRRLITFARRIEPRTDLTFDDLILPDPNRQQLKELRARISHRSRVYSGLGFEHRLSLGRGLIALFTGSSGTGKTMAAELLAREQGVDLYKVDLSAVVSKYVGETEKNLSRVFEEAEDANAIIFFDEADALFGKRGEVKEAQDRWANMEVNFLLQRVEEYAGVVILASNLRQNIDEAFMRRIHVIVEFPFPEAEARFRILGGLFPAGVNHPQVDELRPLTDRFKLSGGSFKNIVLDAAFRALAESNNGKPTLTERRLIAGVAREYQKLGKPITRSEFGEEYFGWIEEDILRG
jgi:SpoVK/Ycf46/Vps4 family AAA+-type ATPase